MKYYSIGSTPDIELLFPIPALSWCASLGQHREGGSILSGSIGSTPEIELLSPIPALAQNTELGKGTLGKTVESLLEQRFQAFRIGVVFTPTSTSIVSLARTTVLNKTNRINKSQGIY